VQLRPNYLQPAHNTKFETTLFATINRQGASKENGVFFTAAKQANIKRSAAILLGKQLSNFI
jgi:hypothetical protein